MHIRRAKVDDAESVADIYNEGIVAASATFETEFRSAGDRRRVYRRRPTGIRFSWPSSTARWLGGHPSRNIQRATAIAACTNATRNSMARGSMW